MPSDQWNNNIPHCTTAADGGGGRTVTSQALHLSVRGHVCLMPTTYYYSLGV